MDGSNPETGPAEAGKAEKRIPRTIRFHDAEWERIESFADQRGVTASEFVRFAALAAVERGQSTDGAADRLAPLIERTFRSSYMIATKMRDDMVAAGRDEEMEALVRAARAVQDEVLGATGG